MRQVVINYITGGDFPIDVFIADIYGNNKSQIGTVTSSVPPQVSFDFTIPPIFQTAPEVMIILKDANNCEIFKILECSEGLLSLLLIFQDGVEIRTQNSQQLIAQQLGTSYNVNIGYTYEYTSCSDTNYVITLFSAVNGWEDIINLYYDPGMSSPFNGNFLWYKSSNSNVLLQINSQGYVIKKFTCL